MTYPPGEIDYLDLSIKMTVRALPKFGKVELRIGSGQAEIVSPKTALHHAFRRRWHLSNVQFLDIDGRIAQKDAESPQCAQVVELFMMSLHSPYMQKSIRHLLPGWRQVDPPSE